MCKVRISNRGNGYYIHHIPEVETDIPSDIYPVIESIFKELNSARKSESEPLINIKKI